MPKRRNQAELAKLEEELAAARPFLALAQEIQADVARAAADPSTHSDLVAELIDRVPLDKRMDLAQEIFDRLSPEQQWAVIERVFGDDEVSAYLEAGRAARVDESRRGAVQQELRRRARAKTELDTREIAAGEQLTLGLFRHDDVRTAIPRGHASSACARRLVLKALGDGVFRVIEDAFNPNGGYFVTAEYSEETWRNHERFGGHSIVRVGSITVGHNGASFDPVLHLGGRVDFEVSGESGQGRLQLGFAMLGEFDLFVPERK